MVVAKDHFLISPPKALLWRHGITSREINAVTPVGMEEHTLLVAFSE